MTYNSNTILNKIFLLNTTAYSLMLEDNKIKIINKFAETSIEIMDADSGFVWWKLENNKQGLTYKSPDISYEPSFPRPKIGKQIIQQKGNSHFDNNVKSKNYTSDIDPSIKSYLIISIHYGAHVYGSIVLCYKKQHNFTEEELVLSNTIGNILTQAMTIHWLIESEAGALKLAEKQKVTETLLTQEKLKTEFITNTTHEFRTPLAIMRGYVDLAMKAKQKNKNELQEARNAFKIINTEIIHLSDMLSDLVLITSERKIKNTINFSLVDLIKLLNATVKRLKTMAKEKNISIEIKSNIANTFVMGNQKYLERLFLNLLENAITYGKSKIKVDIFNSEKNVLIKINDNGVGISKEDLPNIFERFYRSDKSHSSYGKHSGLGLAIVKSITEIHEGKIEVQSIYGKGSTFTVILPKVKK